MGQILKISFDPVHFLNFFKRAKIQKNCRGEFDAVWVVPHLTIERVSNQVDDHAHNIRGICFFFCSKTKMIRIFLFSILNCINKCKLMASKRHESALKIKLTYANKR
jgi:hypothetical protein